MKITEQSITQNILDKFPLHIFCDCLNKNEFSAISTISDGVCNLQPIEALKDIPNSALLLKRIESKEYNMVWIPALVQYIDLSKYNKDIPEIIRIVGEIKSLYLSIHSTHFALNIIDGRTSFAANEMILENCGIEISPETYIQDRLNVIAFLEKNIRKYNRLCAELLLFQPTQKKDYFLNIINQIQEQQKLFPTGTSPEHIYNAITVSEFIQYKNSL